MPSDLRQVRLDLSRDALFDELGIATLRDQHLSPHETSPQQGLARAAAAFADDEAHAQRLYDYASKHWFMFSTPILSNGGTQRGMPISCFLSYVPDSREGILGHYTENGWLSSTGGGTGTYWGALRSSNERTSKGSASSGVIPFVKVVDSLVLSFSQGVTRRGAAAVYLDVSHPEIVEWLSMRRKSGGDLNRKTLNLNNGVCIPDAFMHAVHEGKTWDLVDPHSKMVKQTILARDLWREILITRVETGEPYLFFTDTVNRKLHKALKARGLHVYASNLCTEILLPTAPDRTAVCCLSSVNLARWDEWNGVVAFVPDIMRMLDNVLTFYIENAPPGHEAAVFSAMRERSVGLGAMGFHSFLQDNSIPFNSDLARGYNIMMFEHLRNATNAASKVLAQERGEAPDMEGTGERFAHKMAIAPNATSALVCGNVSPSIEPRCANGYLQKTLGGTFVVKNPTLKRLLGEMGQDTEAVWKSIATNEGSVQHLDFLDDRYKQVFLTAIEIDQDAIIGHAAARQHFIDQGQSVNLFVPPDIRANDLHRLHFSAWEQGLKTLYYCRSQAIKRANIAHLDQERAEIDTSLSETECSACEG